MIAIDKPANPLDRQIAIMNYYERGYFIGPKSAEEIRDELGGTTRGVTANLKALGFTIVAKRRMTRERTGEGRKTRIIHHPRRWGPPTDLAWPLLNQLQRQLRAQGCSPQAVKRAFNNAVIPPSIMEQALGQLVAEGKPANGRGAIKKAVSAVIAERETLVVAKQRQEDFDQYVAPDPYWAESLRESPDASRRALYARTEGLIRAATRKGNWQVNSG